MKYAVIKIGAHQYKVAEGEEIEVNKLPQKEGEKLDFEEVLLAKENSQLKIGKPKVRGAKVSAKILSQFLGKKLHVFKFKAKTGYRRKLGFRPQKTRLKIEKITS
ncbi:MAG TPA: 50S ribosomal protein L21 [Clostridia bacterium]|nr:50S ribosomal protein L21 [Clostridia bacterium]